MKPGQYVGYFNVWSGELVGHNRLNAPASEDIEDYQQENEAENIYQLTLIF